MKPIYLDYNATTPVDPEVAAVMEPFLKDHFGNPSSTHSYGIAARQSIEAARGKVAALINCRPEEIVFTSGGTESNNYALKGVAYTYRHKGKHIITSSIEHPAVLEVCRHLEKEGFRVSYIPVNSHGILDLEVLEKEISPDTILISIMHANNEVGTIQPLKEVAALARNKKIIFHTDAAQSAGKIKVDVNELNIDMLSIAGHKLYGPKGVGALYIRPGIELEKLIHGADHERNRRAGTENLMEIAGLGKACEVAARDLDKTINHLKRTRDLLYTELKKSLPDIVRIGDPGHCLPNTLSIGFPGLEAGLILDGLPDIAASAGAACHSDKQIISHVLEAMEIPAETAMGTIRFSTGKFTTTEEIEKAAGIIIQAIRNLRPGYQDTHKPASGQNEIRLTTFTHGLGCACKMRPQDLEKILKGLSYLDDPRILVDSRTADDAAVYLVDKKTALIQTVDFFTPVVDDPYDFGAIAAANALSDIYAMGGKPAFALNIVGFPVKRLPLEVLEAILEGAKAVAAEAGIQILGGHTIEDPEPKFGMVITGFADPGKILTNAGARPGDDLILTKPIGTGIISTALKRGSAKIEVVDEAVKIMKQLNKAAAEIAQDFQVNACTDITGFGLMGHLLEMIRASKVSAVINASQVPVIQGVHELIRIGAVPGGTRNNIEFCEPYITWPDNISEDLKIIMCDAQTSGGLLYSIPEGISERFLNELRINNIPEAVRIGQITEGEDPRIFVR